MTTAAPQSTLAGREIGRQTLDRELSIGTPTKPTFTATLLPAKDMAEIRTDLEALKAVVGSEDLPRIKAAVQRLEGSAYRIADALYSSADAGEKKTAAKP